MKRLLVTTTVILSSALTAAPADAAESAPRIKSVHMTERDRAPSVHSTADRAERVHMTAV